MTRTPDGRCSNCGAVLTAESARFCSYCGRPVSDVPPPVPVPSSALGAPALSTNRGSPNPVPPTPLPPNAAPETGQFEDGPDAWFKMFLLFLLSLGCGCFGLAVIPIGLFWLLRILLRITVTKSVGH